MDKILKPNTNLGEQTHSSKMSNRTQIFEQI